MTEKIGKCHDCTAPQTEVNMLSRHILELQKDKGNLTDRIKELETENEQIKNSDTLCKLIGEQKRKIAELEAQIEKMKWHKVSDGDLPKDRHNVYVVYMNGYCQLEKTIASFRHKYWVFNGLKTECEIIAWCELPEWR